MNLYVVRHGQVPSNVKGIISGCNDERLTGEGIKQAEYVKEQLGNVKFDVVFCSPVERAKQTLEIINPKAKIIFDDRLSERNPGNMIGHLRKEVNKSEWNSLIKEETIYGGESLLAGINRTQSFLNDIKEKYENKNVLVITHMFICKSIWIIVNNIEEREEIYKFLQKNDEIKRYIY